MPSNWQPPKWTATFVFGFNQKNNKRHLHEHALHLVRDLVVPGLLVSRGVAVHLVHTDADLLHAQQVDEPGVLPGLALDFTGLVVPFGDRRGEVAIGRHHDQRHVGLGGTGDHVLDEVPVTRRVNDGVVPLLREELLGGARDGHSALALLFLPVHEERKSKGALAQSICLRLQLLKLALGQAAQLKNQTSGSGALATVNMTADHDGQVLLLRVGRHLGEFALSQLAASLEETAVENTYVFFYARHTWTIANPGFGNTCHEFELKPHIKHQQDSQHDQQNQTKQ